ncbi:hypothetical protein MNV_800009 [Candidatus Methanoperedens nitroreducens]|uniref:Uncharacterized protein n=1 Tax=Candidatus Methanoperedens nitratireducens TaxID=1392998 RepID=A0A284VTZ4_9EURY|nr:hypothetical protein MNV_800009 [Candidatus Methanoperedens nitroreducens]
MRFLLLFDTYINFCCHSYMTTTIKIDFWRLKQKTAYASIKNAFLIIVVL